MEVHSENKVEMPDYALCYLIYGDGSGLEDSDIKEIDQYMESFYSKAKEVEGYVLVSPEDSEQYFSASPAFGLPCNVVDTNITIFKKG